METTKKFKVTRKKKGVRGGRERRRKGGRGREMKKDRQNGKIQTGTETHETRKKKKNNWIKKKKKKYT